MAGLGNYTHVDGGRFVVDGETVELNLDNIEHFAMRWSIDGDLLTFERHASLGISPTPFVLKPWTRQSPPTCVLSSQAGSDRTMTDHDARQRLEDLVQRGRPPSGTGRAPTTRSGET